MANRRPKAQGTALSAGTHPNNLCCVDYKGEFLLGKKQYYYSLTATDHASRYFLLCEALESTREDPTIEAFEHLFRERGLPLPSARTTACPLLHSTPCLVCPNSRYVGYAWASPSSASSQASLYKMVVTGACTVSSRKKPLGPPP
jgi:hypothetical protein